MDFSRLGSAFNGRSAWRPTQIGPRMELEIVKAEEGMCTGEVLYHQHFTRSKAEVAEKSKEIQDREELRQKRRRQQVRALNAKHTSLAEIGVKLCCLREGCRCAVWGCWALSVVRGCNVAPQNFLSGYFKGPRQATVSRQKATRSKCSSFEKHQTIARAAIEYQKGRHATCLIAHFSRYSRVKYD